MSFEKCAVCRGELVEQQVEKLLRGGVHTAVLNVRAEVCLHCGERLYNAETAKRFEDIRDKLHRQKTDDFQPMGQTFHVT